MAVYNGEKYIKEQIASILFQLPEDAEFIISDDGSSDRTVEIIQSCSDKRILLLKNVGKHGFIGNFENALKSAKGDVIFLSDQDDVWMDNKVSVALSYMKDYDLIIHNADLIDSEGNSLGVDYFSLQHKGVTFWPNFYKTRTLGCCMVFKRKLLEDCLPFPKKIVGHDYWIGMMGIASYKTKFVDQCLLKYRRHGGNVSSSSEQSNKPLFFKIVEKRLLFLLILICRKIKLRF